MLARSARSALEPISSSGVLSARVAVAATTGFKRGEHALAVGLAERDEADAGGNPVGGQRVQKRLQRRFAGDAVAGAGHADGNGQRDGAVPRRVEARKRLAWPRGACRIDKGAALGRGLQEALLGWHQGGGQFGDRAQAFVVIRGDGAVGVDEEHRIAVACRLRRS